MRALPVKLLPLPGPMKLAALPVPAAAACARPFAFSIALLFAFSPAFSLAVSLAVLFMQPAAAAAPPTITLSNGQAAAGWRVLAADPENVVTLSGAAVTVPPGAKQPDAVVRAAVHQVEGRRAVTLVWQKSWYAALRFEAAAPQDLRHYLARGVVTFDLNVLELAGGGIDFKLDCGADCERKVPYVLPARAAAGKGWRTVSIALQCFHRDGDPFEAVVKPFSVEGTGAGDVAIANVRIAAQGTPNTPCADYRTRAVTPEPLQQAWALDWWLPRHEQRIRENAERRAAGTVPQLVFLGDSITEGWARAGAQEWSRRYARYHPVNLGFGGDRTENILWRLQHGEVDGLDPRVVVLMAGTNNTGSRQDDPDHTAAGVRRIVDELLERLPRTKVLLVGVFPRDGVASLSRRLNTAVNERIARLADGRRVFYADFSAAFLDADGVLSPDIMPDLLHPNERGYAIWGAAMDPVLQPLLTGYAWDSVAIGGGGFVSAVIPSPAQRGVVYARTDVGGAYRREGDRWVPLLDCLDEDHTGLLGVEALATDPRDAGKVYLLAGTAYLNGGRSAVLRSRDYGRTFAVTDVTPQFTAHGNGMGRGNGERLAVDPGDGDVLYAGTRAHGLFRSRDAGATWQRLDGLDVTATPNGAGIAFVLPDPASVSNGAARRLFVGISRPGPNLYRSDDGGATFAPVAGTPPCLLPQRGAFDGAGNLYVTFANGAGPHPRGDEPMDRGAVWKYAIAAGEGQDVTPGTRAAYSGISVARDNPRRVLVSTISLYAQQGDAKGDRLLISDDGGAHWTDLVARGFVKDDAGVPWLKGHAIHWASTFAIDPFDAHAAWVTSGNGVFHTANLDAVPVTWRFDVKGLEETVPLGLVSRAGAPPVSSIGDYDGFRHADPAQYGLIHQPQMGTTFGLAFAGTQPQILARAGKAVQVSRDGGEHWRAGRAMHGRNGQVALSADGRVLLHSPDKSAVTYRSIDDGDTWSAAAGIDGARPVADPVDATRFYAYRDGAFLVSSDGGRSFVPRAQLPPGGSDLVRPVPGAGGDVWVALKDGGLTRTRDAGVTFSRIDGVTYAGAVGFGKAAPGSDFPALYLWGTVDGLRGVWRSLDAGNHWLRVNDDAHQYGGPGDGRFVVGDMNVFGRVYMSTAGRGIVYGEVRREERGRD
ncbi:lysophospholipase L1-like esterase [Pseudoduganella lurida]|uniref:Lysophospholipase L1-like esterase n=1 Tax=Pseudoduganella lurida TaxID=1036180 RepID=A0A562RHD4_9BURK|nr:GDSL-type esterase/lipase family protein [Pseudoduganella lurida]TWI67770.1 lysophospholipase L1-like esterase [Pseudoduganella lurida]